MLEPISETCRRFGICLVLTLASLQVHLHGGEASHAQWEPEIRAFEAQDKANPPPAKPIVFIGSSSIRIWKSLTNDFKGLGILNRGFGGSQLSDSVFFFDRIILPYRPRQVFVYAGDNDLAAGKSPETVLIEFQALVRKIEDTLPDTKIAFISIKPSPSRWRLAESMRTANRLIAQDIQSDRRVEFIDVFNPMLNSEGLPQEELFLPDKLHMNEKGYALWKSILLPRLLPQ